MGLLRSLFGPSKEEIWSQLSAEIGAQYQPDGFFRRGKVVLSHKQWQITLDTHTVPVNETSVTYTRIRAPFVNPDGFYFNIYRKHIFSGIAKLLGTQDIEIGEPFFDNEFIIQSNAEEFVRRLLADPEIRRAIQNQPDVHFEVKDDEGWFSQSFPQGVDELYFQTAGVVTDLEQLKGLFDLFARILDQLCRMSPAYESASGMELE